MCTYDGATIDSEHVGMSQSDIRVYYMVLILEFKINILQIFNVILLSLSYICTLRTDAFYVVILISTLHDLLLLFSNEAYIFVFNYGDVIVGPKYFIEVRASAYFLYYAYDDSGKAFFY